MEQEKERIPNQEEKTLKSNRKRGIKVDKNV